MLRPALRLLVVFSALAAIVAFLVAALPATRGERPADSVEAAVVAQANRLHARAPAALADAAETRVAVLPGLPGVAALLVGVDRVPLWLVRQITLVASVFLAVLVLAIVHLECGGWVLALAAAALALVGPALVGPAPGVARPETIAFLFVVLGYGALRFSAGVLGALGAAALLALAWCFHASAGWFVLAAAIAIAWEDRRRAVAFGIASAALVGLGAFVASRLLGPAFAAAAGTGPLPALGGNALAFGTGHLLGRLAPSALVVALSAAIATQPWHERRGTWLVLAGASLVAGLAATPGGGATLGPSLVAVLLVGAIALDLVVRTLREASGAEGSEGEGALDTVVLAQFAVLVATAPHAAWLTGTVAGLLRF